MLVRVRGKNIEVTDKLQQHAERKLARLERYLDRSGEVEVEVELSAEKARLAEDRFRAEVTTYWNGAVLRAEERASDIFTALDSVADVLQRRITRQKERVQQRGRIAAGRAGSAVRLGDLEQQEVASADPDQEEEILAAPRIVRTKMISVKPMSEEEAAEQMELLGHDFFVFESAENASLAVIYRRRDGNYGLITTNSSKE